jgi:hypothetical protein
MCEARLPFEHRKAWGDRTNANVPAGTLDPAGARREFAICYAVCTAVSWTRMMFLNSISNLNGLAVWTPKAALNE